MTIIYRKREIHLDNPSLEELCQTVCQIRSDPSFNDFKIMINGTNEETDLEGKFCLSE